jgi:excisionase family DNA binding protein
MPSFEHLGPEVRRTDESDHLLRTADVAALFHVSPRTVSEWARSGRVPCLRTPGGQWRYPAARIRQLVERAHDGSFDVLMRSPSPAD